MNDLLNSNSLEISSDLVSSKQLSVGEDARILAIIPARGGSKRIPRKNARLLGGRPLIVWSINTAISAGIFCDVLLTTDDQEIADIGRESGALVPWLRPTELATDTATTSEVVQHALSWYENELGAVDGVVLLQPTCPLRRVSSVRGALQRFLSQTADKTYHTVVSVSPSLSPPEWCFSIAEVNGALQPILGWSEIGNRSQDLKPTYHLNGSIYVASSDVIRSGRPFIEPGALAFVMNGIEESIDIDIEEDWHLAEALISLNQR